MSATAIVAISGVSAGVAGAAIKAPPFATGTYVAKTAQGSAFTFRVEAHTAANHCGTRATQHCFIAVSYPAFDWSCGGGASTDAGTFDVPNGFINRAGRFSYSQPLQGTSEPLLKFTATISGTHASGTLREKELTDNGSGSTVTCDSGTVHWTAHLRRTRQ